MFRVNAQARSHGQMFAGKQPHSVEVFTNIAHRHGIGRETPLANEDDRYVLRRSSSKGLAGGLRGFLDMMSEFEKLDNVYVRANMTTDERTVDMIPAPMDIFFDYEADGASFRAEMMCRTVSANSNYPSAKDYKGSITIPDGSYVLDAPLPFANYHSGDSVRTPGAVLTKVRELGGIADVLDLAPSLANGVAVLSELRAAAQYGFNVRCKVPSTSGSEALSIRVDSNDLSAVIDFQDA